MIELICENCGRELIITEANYTIPASVIKIGRCICGKYDCSDCIFIEQNVELEDGNTELRKTVKAFKLQIKDLLKEREK